ncbi:MAG: HEPN domain-containing protein [Deltaproteobacteria bacterium]|nr:HEPN domain-containing protein [Deltaproteobacteria bacterium]
MDTNKATESLEAAGLCYDKGLYNSAVSRAYCAMYQAAQYALERAGFKRVEWTHSGLQATFANELTRRQKLFSALWLRTLTRYKTCATAQIIVISASANDKQHEH